MKSIVVLTAFTATALLFAPPDAARAAVAPGQKPVAAAFSFGNEGLRICTSGFPEQGSAQFAVERMDGTGDPMYGLTPVLNPGGNAGASDPANTCYDLDVTPGTYRVTPGKYMSARCLKTANGHVVEQPTAAKPSGLTFTDQRCHAFVHHFHTKHPDVDANGDGVKGDLSVLEVPEVVVDVAAGLVTEVDAHVVPDNYPECTTSTSPNGPNRVCEPTGPTS